MKYHYIILWKLVDGTYETYKKPFDSEQEALNKVKELGIERIDTAEEWFSKPRSNGGIRDYDIIEVEAGKNFLFST